jgi:hypothetical protein
LDEVSETAVGRRSVGRNISGISRAYVTKVGIKQLANLKTARSIHDDDEILDPCEESILINLPRGSSPSLLPTLTTLSIYFIGKDKMKSPMFLSLVVGVATIQDAASFGVISPVGRQQRTQIGRPLFMSTEDEIKFSSPEQKKDAVGYLVADDEWEGLGMELTEAISRTISEDMKQNAREFLGKEDYKVGDISKEIDSRVKEQLAKLRGKEEYELGDFSLAMDELSKSMVEEYTGKPYEFGDLSTNIDAKVKESTAKFCGKDSYEFGDLSVEVDRRVQERVGDFTGKDNYEFGDVAREVENRREEWAKEFLGEDAAANYEFGDLTKKSISNWTGKDDYQFGDITKKLAGNLFGKKKK